MRYKINANWPKWLISCGLCFLIATVSAQNNSQAMALFNNGQYLKAIDAFNILIKANKHDTDAYGYRGLRKSDWAIMKERAKILRN